jgi:cyd operon protein YbgT
MWYFSWILGLAFALAFSVINAMWYEFGGRGIDVNLSKNADDG